MAVPRISKEDLKERLEAPEAARPTVLDARLKYPYEHSSVRLPGAIRVTPGTAPDTSRLARDRDIVVYDSDPDELTASDVAVRLIGQGFRAVVLKGGIAEWMGANLPVDTKDAPKPTPPAKA